ncbi:MAG: ribonuclease P protein component [Betaproteobacteria bacterium]|nr:ribonuclease P protein component [Betaproteobacteria bacterium]
MPKAGLAWLSEPIRLPAIRSARFAKHQRLCGASAFDRAFKIGRRKTGRHFAVHWIASNDLQGRLGLVVPKRLTRTGVARNFVKRMVREVYRQSDAIKSPLNVVVRLKTMFAPGDRQVVRQELERLLANLE